MRLKNLQVVTWLPTADRLGCAEWLGTGDPFGRYRWGNVDPETQGLCRPHAGLMDLGWCVRVCAVRLLFLKHSTKNTWVTGSSWYWDVLLYIGSFYHQSIFFLQSWNIVESTKATNLQFLPPKLPIQQGFFSGRHCARELHWWLLGGPDVLHHLAFTRLGTLLERCVSLVFFEIQR